MNYQQMCCGLSLGLLLIYLTRLTVHGYDKWEKAFSFASYYQDHMVLQRAPECATVWGYADSADLGQLIKVSVSSSQGTDVYEARVRIGPAAGLFTWRVKLNAYPASSTPHTIQASLGSHSPINVSDVLFGDVWVCSGQSNMVFMVKQMFNNTAEYALASDFPEVRLLKVSQVLSTEPYYDITKYDLNWSLPNKGSLEIFSAVCWLYARHVYAKMHVPMGMIVSAWGGTPIEAWSSPEALHKCGLSSESSNAIEIMNAESDSLRLYDPPGQHHVLWNAMIHPLLNMTIYGVLWYQGEANSFRDRDLYNCTFSSMIADWRSKWLDGSMVETQPHFPFGFVQLGPNNNNISKPIFQGYSDVRWHQTYDKGYVPNPSLPNVFMAVANDLTDRTSPYGTVHYRDKGTAGERLSFSGLSVAYGVKGLRYQGPWPSAMKINGSSLQLQIVYDHDLEPISVRVKHGFEVCCNKEMKECPMSGNDWLPSSIMTFSNTSVTLSLDACANLILTGVRYNWRETPCEYKQCAVYSVENQLPAPPLVVQSIKAPRLSPNKPYRPVILISYQVK